MVEAGFMDLQQRVGGVRAKLRSVQTEFQEQMGFVRPTPQTDRQRDGRGQRTHPRHPAVRWGLCWNAPPSCALGWRRTTCGSGRSWRASCRARTLRSAVR